MKNDDGTTVKGKPDILAQKRCFYEQLYACSNNLSIDDFISDIEYIPALSEDQKSSCEGLLTIAEYSDVLKTFSKNKSPGCGGFLPKILG